MTRFMIALIMITLAINCYGVYKVHTYTKDIPVRISHVESGKTVLGHRIGPGGQLMLVTGK